MEKSKSKIIKRRNADFGKPATHILYFENYNLVCFSIPKAANSSIKHYLLPLTGHEKKIYNNIHKDVSWNIISKKRFKEIKANIFSFAVTRNPYERLISAYKDKVRDEIHIPLKKQGFIKGMPFLEFLKTLEKQKPIERDIHLKTQYELLTSGNQLLPHLILDVTEIKKLEGILRKIVSMEGGKMPGIIPRLNKTKKENDIYKIIAPNAKLQIDKIRCKKTFIDLTEKIYEKDLKIFGYEYPY